MTYLDDGFKPMPAKQYNTSCFDFNPLPKTDYNISAAVRDFRTLSLDEVKTEITLREQWSEYHFRIVLPPMLATYRHVEVLNKLYLKDFGGVFNDPETRHISKTCLYDDYSARFVCEMASRFYNKSHQNGCRPPDKPFRGRECVCAIYEPKNDRVIAAYQKGEESEIVFDGALLDFQELVAHHKKTHETLYFSYNAAIAKWIGASERRFLQTAEKNFFKDCAHLMNDDQLRVWKEGYSRKVAEMLESEIRSGKLCLDQ